MKENLRDVWIDRVGMAAIALVSLGYVLFGASFAQLRLEFSFLNFPVFIGEILLGFSSVLFIVKSARQKWEFKRWGWVLWAYLFFVLLKAFTGYFVWGPMAFRNAALFYYPFFAVLGYSFWSDGLWGEKVRRSSIAVILAIFILYQFQYFWPCSLVIMGVLLALEAKSPQERMLLTGAVILLAPYNVLFNVFYRTVFFSSLVTVIFIGVIFFLLFCRNRWVRIMGIVLGGIILGVVLFKASQTGMGRTFLIKNAKPAAAVLPQELPQVKYLFHPVGRSSGKPDTIKEFWRRMSKGCISAGKKYAVAMNSDVLEVKKDDTLFRYYIWRDMASEYARYKPLFGFDFGRPLISPTIAKYFGMSSTQYRDGWVGSHNSFFDMIYLAGIIGLVMVFSLLFVWLGLVRDFYILKDWTGILLCAILLNWMAAANFFLIFELPYTAIPVWAILGITLKHRALLKNLSHTIPF